MFHQLTAKPFRRITRQLARQVVHCQDGDALPVVKRALLLGARVVAVNGIFDGRRTQRTRHRPVNVAADVRHDVDLPIRVPHVLSREEERRPLGPEMACDEEVRGMGIPREGAFKFQRIRHEIIHAERSPIGARVVVLDIQVREHRLGIIHAQEVVRVHGAELHVVQYFASALPHPAMACEDNLEVRGKGDTLNVREHFFEVAAVDGLGQFKRSAAQAIGTQSAVGSNEPGPTTEADDAATAGALQQFVIDEADFLIENGREQLGVVRLQFVGVAEKEVGLAGHQVLYVDLLHPNEDIAIRDVFAYIEARGAVLGIPDAAHRAGLNGNF